MKLDKFVGPGSTPSRRKFWDKARHAVIASQKIAGRNITVDEYPSGSVISVISVPDSRKPSGPTCTSFSSTLTATFSGMSLCSGCIEGTVNGSAIHFKPEYTRGSFDGSIVCHADFTNHWGGFGLSVMWDIKRYSDSGCVTLSGENDFSVVFVDIYCQGGILYVLCGGSLPPLFYAPVTALSLPASNTIGCGTIFAPVGFGGSETIGVGSGGTVTIT